MGKLVIIILVVLAIAIGGYFLVESGSDSDDSSGSTETTQSNSESQTETESNPPENNTPEEITAEQVTAHSSASDCWTIIDGVVYDITEYVPRHPGGDEILQACGTDGSSLFNQRTTADGETVGSGTPHSSNASSQLSAFEIGVVAN